MDRRSRPRGGKAQPRGPGSASPPEAVGGQTSAEALRSIEQEFLNATLQAVDADLEQRRSYLESVYADVSHLPPGERDLLAVHQRERALLRDIAREAEARPLFEVLEHRLLRLQERLTDLERPNKRTEKARSQFWKARLDIAILNALTRRWLRWFYRQPRGGTASPLPTQPGHRR